AGPGRSLGHRGYRVRDARDRGERSHGGSVSAQRGHAGGVRRSPPRRGQVRLRPSRGPISDRTSGGEPSARTHGLSRRQGRTDRGGRPESRGPADRGAEPGGRRSPGIRPGDPDRLPLGRPASRSRTDPGASAERGKRDGAQAAEDGVSPKEADPLDLGEGPYRIAGGDLCPSGSHGATVRAALSPTGPAPSPPRSGAPRDPGTGPVRSVSRPTGGQRETESRRPRRPEATRGRHRPPGGRGVSSDPSRVLPPHTRRPRLSLPGDLGAPPRAPAPNPGLRPVPRHDSDDPVDPGAP